MNWGTAKPVSTYSAIDKIGHMWGGGDVDTLANYKWDPTSIFREVHMPWAAQNADEQLGRLIATLKANKDWGQTLIVVTADHDHTMTINGYLCYKATTTLNLNQVMGGGMRFGEDTIGGPIANFQLYVLDPHMQPVAPGVSTTAAMIGLRHSF